MSYMGRQCLLSSTSDQDTTKFVYARRIYLKQPLGLMKGTMNSSSSHLVMNAPATFQALVNEVIRQLLRKYVLVFFEVVCQQTEMLHSPKKVRIFGAYYSRGRSSRGPSKN